MGFGFVGVLVPVAFCSVGWELWFPPRAAVLQGSERCTASWFTSGVILNHHIHGNQGASPPGTRVWRGAALLPSQGWRSEAWGNPEGNFLGWCSWL